MAQPGGEVDVAPAQPAQLIDAKPAERERGGRLEGLNSKIRLISHRAFGVQSADALIALVYLCCAGITIDLPR